MNKKVKVFGLNFRSFSSIEDAVSEVFQSVKPGELPIVMTPNVDQIVNLEEDQELKRYLSRSYLVLPDGMPIVWTSKLHKISLPIRISGSDIFPLFWRKVVDTKKKILFIASSKDVCEKLQSEYEGVSCYVPPFFDINTAEYESALSNISEKIQLESPEYIVVGISYPKRELICRDLIEKHGNCNSKYLLIGAAPEFYLGIKKRAPIWMQESGLEWFHRLLSEPRRLFKRYLITSFKFLPILIKEIRNR